MTATGATHVSRQGNTTATTTRARLWALRRPLLMLFVPWMLLVIPLGVFTHEHLLQNISEPMDELRQDLLSRATQVMSRSLISMQRDVRFIASSDELRAAMDTGHRERLARLLQHLAIASGQYAQLRWIDANGREAVRVDYTNGVATITPERALQDKSARDYFRETMAGEPGDVHVSPLDLNIENGELEIPFKPMLRISVTVTGTDGKPAGIVVVNYLADVMLERLRLVGGSTGAEVHLLNGHGFWLLAPRPDMAWGFMTGDSSATVGRTMPRLWQAMTTRGNGTYSTPDRFWSFRRVSPLHDVLAPTRISEDRGEHWYLAIAMSTDRLVQQSRKAALYVSAAAIALLLLALRGAMRQVLANDDRERALCDVRDNERRLATANGELQDLLAQLRTMQHELIRAEKLSSLGMMVAGVAHELNTPLGSAVVTVSTLQRHLQTLAGRVSSGELRRSDLETYIGDSRDGLLFAAEALNRAAVLVKRFKQLAVDRATSERRHFELVDVVEDSLHLLRHRPGAGAPVVQLEIPRPLAMDSYAGALGQVISNLVDNALKYAFAERLGGTVRVTATCDDGSERVVIRVSDDGIGMPREVAAHAFDPFFTTGRGAGGTGLGLFIAHQLSVEVLGGRLSLDTAPGQGTTFTLDIPLTAPLDSGRPVGA
jgi:signal transduction histidine kinase